MLDRIPSFALTIARFAALSILKIFRRYFMTWISFEESIDVLVKKIAETNYEPTVIVGISGGGLIVAEMLGKKYSRKVPVLSLPFDRLRDDKNVQRIHIPSNLFSLTFAGQRVLLVDDCTLSGTVMKHMIEYLTNTLDEKDRPKELKTLTVGLIYDDSSKYVAVQPDYYALRIKARFKFPWGYA